MPNVEAILGKPVDEEKWSRAKERAKEEGQEGNWAYVMDIYKKMTHSGEFTEQNIAYRKKKKMKVPEWRKKKKYSPKQYQKSAVDSSSGNPYNKGIRLVLADGGALNEFRCGACEALLLKGLHLEKSMIEVKCRRCGTVNVNR